MSISEETDSSTEPNREQMASHIRTMHPNGDAFEVRMLVASGSPLSGVFDDVDAATTAIEQRGAINTYFTVNRLAEHVTVTNTLRPARTGSATADSDITNYCHLFVDFDPVRPSGVNATAEERESAWERADHVAERLAQRGWPEFPVWAGSSGSGCVLFYRIDVPATESDLIKRVLKALSDLFSDDVVKVDTTVCNPARIVRLAGTRNVKSPTNTRERPWTLAEGKAFDSRVVDRELLIALAARVERPSTATRDTASAPMWDMRTLLALNNIPIRSEAVRGGTTFYNVTCPTGKHEPDTAAFFQRESGQVGFTCFHDTCQGKSWDDVKPQLRFPQRENGGRDRVHFSGNSQSQGLNGVVVMRNGVDSQAQFSSPPNPLYVCGGGDNSTDTAITPLDSRHHPSPSPIDGGDEKSGLRFWTLDELFSEPGIDTDWLVFGLVARGAITDVVGKPKSAGKTTFMFSMIRAITTGADFLGESCQQTKVVYLTEQSRQATIPALKRAGLISGDAVSPLFHPETSGASWPEIVDAAVAHANAIGAGLLVVDTVLPWVGIRGDDENNSGKALEALEPLQRAAANHNLAIVTVRHAKKSDASVGDDGRGSNAFAGGVDILLSLRSPDGAHKGRPNVRKLEGLGRLDDIPAELAIEFDGTSYTVVGRSDAFVTDETTVRIMGILPDSESNAMPFTLVCQLAAGASSERTIERSLKSLVSAGRVHRTGEGGRWTPFRYWRQPVATVQVGSVIHSSTRLPISEMDMAA